MLYGIIYLKEGLYYMKIKYYLYIKYFVIISTCILLFIPSFFPGPVIGVMDKCINRKDLSDEMLDTTRGIINLADGLMSDTSQTSYVVHWLKESNQAIDYENILSDDEYHFHDKVYDESIMIVRVSSPYEIYMNDFQYKVDFGINGEHESTKAFFYYGFVTNGSKVMILRYSLSSEIYLITQKDLRYLHVNAGSFNYTEDNRPKYMVSGWGRSGWANFPWNFSLPAGTWYFVFTGGMFDVDEDFLRINISAWLNFSSASRDLEISTFTGGKVYSLCSSDFDANLIASRRVYREADVGFDKKGFEVMLGGNARFHSNHSFFYFNSMDYYHVGFIKIRWDTPMGDLEYFSSNGLRDIKGIGDVINESCFLNIGGPGDYELRLDYVNWKPLSFWLGGGTWPVYFIALDIELP